MNQDPNEQNPGGGYYSYPIGGTDTTPPTVSNPQPGDRYRTPTGNGWWEYIAGAWHYFESTPRGTQQNPG
jgi:hypothetical protein